MIKEINQAIMTARKGGNKFYSRALSLVKAELLNNTKAKKPEQEIKLIQGYVKRLEKASHAFKKVDIKKYADLVKEIQIVKEYLPTELSADEVEKEVLDYLKVYPCNGNKEMGLTIKAIKVKIGDQNGQNIARFVGLHMSKPV